MSSFKCSSRSDLSAKIGKRTWSLSWIIEQVILSSEHETCRVAAGSGIQKRSSNVITAYFKLNLKAITWPNIPSYDRCPVIVRSVEILKPKSRCRTPHRDSMRSRWWGYKLSLTHNSWNCTSWWWGVRLEDVPDILALVKSVSEEDNLMFSVFSSEVTISIWYW